MIAREMTDERPVVAPPEARTLVDLLLWHGRVSGSRVGAQQKVDGVWKDFTWSQILERSRRLSDGLVQLGISKGDRVCIFANTSLDWCLADFAIMGAGAVPVPIYASDTPEEIAFIVNDCGAKAVFVDHDRPDGRALGRWTRLSSVAAKMPTVEHYFCFELGSAPAEKRVGVGELEELGGSDHAKSALSFEERARMIGPGDLNCIIYTSGTTGSPKGVMLSHRAWAYQASAIGETGIMAPTDTLLLFLPLAHVFARVVESAWLGQGFRLAFAESIEKAVDNAAEVHATVVPAVPRVFEKAYSKVTADGASQPGVKGKLFGWAMKLFEEYAAAREAGQEFGSAQWSFAKRLVFSKISAKLKARFGGNVRLFISGSAPLSRKIAYFFELCGLVILEGYGLTETSAPTHVNRIERRRIGTVGPPFRGTEAKIAGDGEILLRGPQVMIGYYKLPQETAAVLDADGWLHTGDIGEIDRDGFLTITDRKKDMIKTSGGKYVAPQLLENALKTEPVISQAAIIGDRRRFVSALFTISEENAGKLAASLKLPPMAYSELTRHPEIRERVRKAVDTLNLKLPSYATVKKFAILEQDWSQLTGELTPKLSVKRKVVAEKYKPIIDGLYEGDAAEF